MTRLLVASLLGEASAAETAEVERALAADPDFAAERERLAATIGLVRSLGTAPADSLSPAAAARLADAAQRRAPEAPILPGPFARRRSWIASPVFRAAASVLLVLGAFALWNGTRRSEQSRSKLDAQPALEVARADGNEGRSNAQSVGAAAASRASSDSPDSPKDAISGADLVSAGEAGSKKELIAADLGERDASKVAKNSEGEVAIYEDNLVPQAKEIPPEVLAELQALGYGGGGSSTAEALAFDKASARTVPPPMAGAQSAPGAPGSGGAVDLGVPAVSQEGGVSSQAMLAATERKQQGTFSARKAGEKVVTGADEFFLGRGETSREAALADAKKREGESLDQLRKLGYIADGRGAAQRLRALGYADSDADAALARLTRDDRGAQLSLEQRAALIDMLLASCRRRGPQELPRDMFYRWWGDNPFEYARHDPLSTFSVDVDTASYTLARRYLVERILPSKQQVRTEEFVNYFKGDVPPPSEGTFAVAAELAPSLFNRSPDTWMLRVAVRGREVSRGERKPLALTFVVDVSGSMKEQNRLELVKHALRLLVAELDVRDSVALVAFTNDARLVLPMTSARNRGLIEAAIHPLKPEGGTNVQAGLRMGYESALAGLAPEANNRVVFLSDGVGNIGQTDAETLNVEVERARSRGIYLNTVGVGMNNHNDAFLEQLADKGDGICNYVDDEREARRALVENFTGAFEPIARDVKIQVEFDPAQVERYRLLGYENRAVADADFRNDAVDAGEVGSGHQVVALYEIVRAGQGDGESPLATVRLRWKAPHAVAGNPEEQPASESAWTVRARHAAGSFAATSAGYRRSVLVGQLAEVLRRSIHARDDSLEILLAQARKLAPELGDPDFDEFVKMVESTIELIATEWGRYDVLARRLDALRMQNYLRAQLEDRSLEIDRSKLEALEAQARELEAEIRRELEPGPDGSIRGLGYYK